MAEPSKSLPGSTLDIPTPIQPISSRGNPTSSGPESTRAAPGSERGSPQSGPLSTPAASTPGATALAGWTEKQDASGWTVVYRPVSPIFLLLFGVLVLGMASLILTQHVFGVNGVIGVVIGLGIATFVALLISRTTYFRLDPIQVSVEQKPGGTAWKISTYKVLRFLVIDEGPKKETLDFHVHYLPIEGDPERVAINFSTDGDARFVAQRLNEILANVRGRSVPRDPS
jgi:hypothetical protein